MKEENFWIQELQKQLRKNTKLFSKITALNIQLYLFGSACVCQHPNDIDIVLLYSFCDCKLFDIIGLREEIKDFLRKKYMLNVDIVTLSIEEEKQSHFLYQENAQLLL